MRRIRARMAVPHLRPAWSTCRYLPRSLRSVTVQMAAPAKGLASICARVPTYDHAGWPTGSRNDEVLRPRCRAMIHGGGSCGTLCPRPRHLSGRSSRSSAAGMPAGLGRVPSKRTMLMSSSDILETTPGWLAADTIESVRAQVPIVYVEAVPVRVDHLGRIAKVGMLLRAQADGAVSRAVVSGRVLFGETLRDALWRNLNKDLGPDAAPNVPPGVAPFTVAEYFPDPERSGFHDPRQHAVALGYVVPCDGDCKPAHDALDLAWLSPDEANSGAIAEEMSSGHGRLVRRALAFCGQLP